MIEYSQRPYQAQLGETANQTFTSVWETLHHNDPYALPTQTRAWLDVAKGNNGQDASQLFSLPNGQKLLLPLIKTRSFPFVSGGSMPQHWGYGGLLSQQALTAVDIQSMWQALRKLGWQSIRIRPNPLQAAVWENGRIPQVKSIPRQAHVLDLTAGFDHVWTKQFKSGMRRNVRKAEEKAGLTIACDTAGELVPEFYTLFEASIARWGKQQNEPLWLARWRGVRRDPMTKFERLIKGMNGMAKLWLAKLQDEPVAAILVLQNQNAHYTRGVMNKALANKTRANDYLHFLAIKDACAAGCVSYHMGETGQSASLAQFKEKFGARPFPYAEYYLERLPLTAMEMGLKTAVKQAINFKD